MKIFSAIPLNPPESALVEVLFTDMLGGSGGIVPWSDTMGFMEVMRVSMDGVGLGMAGELGSWTLW
jgi:hypothetical protein